MGSGTAAFRVLLICLTFVVIIAHGGFNFPDDCHAGLYQRSLPNDNKRPGKLCALALYGVYTYNSRSGRCVSTVSGECGRSNNNFGSEEECLRACCPGGKCVKAKQ